MKDMWKKKTNKKVLEDSSPSKDRNKDGDVLELVYHNVWQLLDS